MDKMVFPFFLQNSTALFPRINIALIGLFYLLMVVNAGPVSASTASIAPLPFDDAIANSSSQFAFTQGRNGWSYGFWVQQGTDASYDPQQFRPFLKCIYEIWRTGKTSLPWISRTDVCPGHYKSAALVPIRRWRTKQNGSMRLVGLLQRLHPGKGELLCRVYVNGQVRWSYHLSPTDSIPHCFDILLLDTPAGSYIDMALFPSDSENGSPVTWTAQIIPEPSTSWSPYLPIGPIFTPAQKDIQRKAGKQLLKSIENASSKGSSVYTIPPGDYRFSADWNYYPHIKNLRNMVVNATGVTFWFDAPDIFGLEFDDCRNVKVKGLTLDFDPLPFFQARVTAIDTRVGTITGTIMPGYEPSEVGGNRTIFYYRPDGSFIRNGVIQCEWQRNGEIVTVKAPAPGVSAGDYFACPIRTGQTLRVIGCGNMTFEDCNIYAGGGMAVMEADGPGGDVYKRVRCTRRPGTNRLHAFGADGFHISVMEKGPVLDECEGAYLADDEVNVHGRFSSIIKKLAENRYIMAGEPNPFVIGGNLSFWDFSTLMPLGDSIIKSVSPLPDGKSWDVTMDKSLNLPVGALIDPHRQDSRYFVIKNCWFHDTAQRFLINGAPYGLIENNTFQNIGGNINIHEESWAGYTEGCFASGVNFRNNRILECGGGGASAEAYFQGGIMVVVVPGGGNYLRHSTPIHNFTIENNYLEDVPGVPIYVTNVNGLKILGNVIDKPFSSPDWPGFDKPIADPCGDLPDSPIFLASVRNAAVENNKIYDPSGYTDNRTIATGPLTQNISVNGKPIWNTIADFITGWTPAPSQGGAGWYYGYIDTGSMNGDSYSPDHFQQFTMNEDGWRNGPGQLPVIWQTSMHPSDNQAAVRRWISPASGTLAVEGVIQCASDASVGDYGSIYLDGKKVWQQDTGDHKPHRFRVLLRNVKKGAPIDFVVGPHGSIQYDTTLFYAKIMSPPESRMKKPVTYKK
jgi:hypothetical protein